MGKEKNYVSSKEDIIGFVAGRTGVKKETSKQVVNEAFTVIEHTIAAHQAVAIAGFGVFKPVKRAARTGRNPGTGETIQIPEKTTVVFKPYGDFKEKLNA